MGFRRHCMYVYMICISCNASPDGSNLLLRQQTRLEVEDGDLVCQILVGFEPRAEGPELLWRG